MGGYYYFLQSEGWSQDLFSLTFECCRVANMMPWVDRMGGKSQLFLWYKAYWSDFGEVGTILYPVHSFPVPKVVWDKNRVTLHGLGQDSRRKTSEFSFFQRHLVLYSLGNEKIHNFNIRSDTKFHLISKHINFNKEKQIIQNTLKCGAKEDINFQKGTVSFIGCLQYNRILKISSCQG